MRHDHPVPAQRLDPAAASDGAVDGASGSAWQSLPGDVRQSPLCEPRRASPQGPDLRIIIDDIDSILWEVELRSMRFTMVSQQAERILGYPIERWLSDPTFWQDHIHPDDRDSAVDYCAQETKKCRGHEFEYRMLAANGKVIWLRDIVSVVAEGGQPVWLRGVMVDITRQKQAEQERDRLLEQTREALRLREEFIAVAAHELRTPVNVLGLLVDSLGLSLQRGDLSLPARHERKIEQAGVQVERLTRLVSTLLDVSSLLPERLRLCTEQFDLRDAVRSAISALSGDIAAAGAAVQLTDGPPVTGRWDRKRVEQLALSLLSNAVRYGQGKPIDVEVLKRGTGAALVVRDRGIGIAAEDHQRIFERFERAVSFRSYGGLGLGLYIARSIARAHGGSIEVSSEPGAGSTFVAHLPGEAPAA